MQKLNDQTEQESALEQVLFELVLKDAAPWIFPIDENRNNWRMAALASTNEQMIATIMHEELKCCFSALICCNGEPETLAVSFADSKPGQLNPYIEGGEKLEYDLDGLCCWNVLAITFQAEEGAKAVRYLRNNVICEAEVNACGFVEIVDWDNHAPVDEYLAVNINGNWVETAVSVLPYTIDHFKTVWRCAVKGRSGLKICWNGWMRAVFASLGGVDRAKLQAELEAILANDPDPIFETAFRVEHRRFLKQGTGQLRKVLETA